MVDRGRVQEVNYLRSYLFSTSKLKDRERGGRAKLEADEKFDLIFHFLAKGQRKRRESRVDGRTEI